MSDYKYDKGEYVNSEFSEDDLVISDATITTDKGVYITANETIKKKDKDLETRVRTALSAIGESNDDKVKDEYYDVNKTVYKSVTTTPYKTKDDLVGYKVDKALELNKEASDKKYNYDILTFDFTNSLNQPRLRQAQTIDTDDDYYSFPNKDGASDPSSAYSLIRKIVETNNKPNNPNQTTYPLYTKLSEPFLYVEDFILDDNEDERIIPINNITDFDKYVKPSNKTKISFASFVFDDNPEALPTQNEVGNDLIYDSITRKWKVYLKGYSKDKSGKATQVDLHLDSIIDKLPKKNKMVAHIDIKRPEYFTYRVTNDKDIKQYKNGVITLEDLEKKYGPIYTDYNTSFKPLGNNQTGIVNGYTVVTYKTLSNMIHYSDNEYEFYIEASTSYKYGSSDDITDNDFTITLVATKDDRYSRYVFPNQINIFKSSINISNLFDIKNSDKGNASVSLDPQTIKLTGDFDMTIKLSQETNNVKVIPSNHKDNINDNGTDRPIDYRFSEYKDYDVDNRVFAKSYSIDEFKEIVDNGSLDYKVSDDGENSVDIQQLKLEITNIIEYDEVDAFTIPVMNICSIMRTTNKGDEEVQYYYHYNAANSFILRTIPKYYSEKGFPDPENTTIKNSASFYIVNEYKKDDEGNIDTKKYTKLICQMNIKISAYNKLDETYDIVPLDMATQNNIAEYTPPQEERDIKPIAPGIIKGDNMELSRSNIVSDKALENYLKAYGIDSKSELYDILDSDEFVDEYISSFPFDRVVTDEGVKLLDKVNYDDKSEGMTWYEAVIQAFSKEVIRIIGKYLLEGQVRVNKETIEYIYKEVFTKDGLVDYVNDIFNMTTKHKDWIDDNRDDIDTNTENITTLTTEVNGVKLEPNGRKGQYKMAKFWTGNVTKGLDYQNFEIVRTGNTLHLSGLIHLDNVKSALNSSDSSKVFILSEGVRPSVDILLPATIVNFEKSANTGDHNISTFEPVNIWLRIKRNGDVGIVEHPQNLKFAKNLSKIISKSEEVESTVSSSQVSTTTTKTEVTIMDNPYMIVYGSVHL